MKRMLKRFKPQQPSIKFRYREDHALLDRPNKASKFLPRWFKDLPRVPEGEHKNQAGTVKRCVPVLDAVTNGYIIPSWCDWHVTVGELKVDGEGNELDQPVYTVYVEASGNIGFPEMIDDHSWSQVGDDCPIKHYPVGNVLLKFINPWVIETPPGWSCLFKSPPNHFSNVRIIEGVVDTDTYHRPINFPFFWDGCKQGEFSIKKGDPLVHVIPFKRKELELQYDTWDHEYMSQIDVMHSTHFFDKYRRLFWHKARQKEG